MKDWKWAFRMPDDLVAELATETSLATALATTSGIFCDGIGKPEPTYNTTTCPLCDKALADCAGH